MHVFLNGSQPETARQWVREFERYYFARRAKTPESLTTWKMDYLNVYRHLPQDQPLTPESLLKAALTTSPDSHARKRFCMALGAIAKFAEIPIDLKPFKGKHSPKRRELPDDQLIQHWFYQIKNPQWQWVYGMLATYGLRPHEIFHLDYRRLESGDVGLRILAGKTGARLTFPLFPEWVEQFNLLKVQLPDCSGRNNVDLGARVTRAFARMKIPFPAYSLRHCWAIRSIEFGLDLSLAALQMGHSVAVHTNSYHAWIAEKQHRKAFESIMQNASRPKAPGAELIEGQPSKLRV